MISPLILLVQAATAPIVTDRPDQTESSETVPRGLAQLEAGWMKGENFGSLARLGVSSRLEGRLGFGGSGPYHIEPGLKYRLRDGTGAAPTIAILAHVVILSDLGVQSANLIVAAAHELSETVSTGYNIGLSVEDVAELTCSWTFGFSLSEKLGAFAEAFATTQSGLSLDGGFTIPLTRQFQLDVSGGRGLSGTSHEWFYGLGASWRIPR